MSGLLSKLEPRDNADFGREMHREKKEENVTNLINWLHQEAPLRSREKTTDDGNGGEGVVVESPTTRGRINMRTTLALQTTK